MKENKTTPVAKSISWWVPKAYPISKAILVVSGLTLSVMLDGIIGLFPATNITAIVSPIALPIPNTTAVKIPDLAAGKITLNMVSICDAPSARDASFYCLGTDFIAVSATEIIVGNIITESTIIIASKLCPLGRFNLF